MDKFNNSNSTLALQKFYNQQNNVKLFELQQRLKTEQIVCQIEMKKLINEKKIEDKIEEKIEEQVEELVINEEQVEEPGLPTVSSDTMQIEEPLSGESLGEIYYRSNENFEIDKPITLERTKSTIINQTKINNLIKLKKW